LGWLLRLLLARKASGAEWAFATTTRLIVRFAS
jgi:hypothetical protein